MLCRFEYCHVCSDLSNDVAGEGFINVWYIRGQLDQVIVRFREFYDGFIQFFNDRGNNIF